MTTHPLTKTTLWTALVTPMLSDGSIDFKSLGALALEQQDANNGLLILGSTGEALALSYDDQQAIVRHICSLKLTVPIMVGVGGANLQQQQQWIEFCNSQPIDALLLGAPLYAKPGPKGQLLWYRSLLDTAKKPCMLYNVPGRAACHIYESVLTELQAHANCYALKEASGDLEQVKRYRSAAPMLAIYSGDDALLPQFVKAGAQGLVSVAANVWPHATAHYTQQCLAGDEISRFDLWLNAAEALFCVANPIPAKSLLAQQKRITSGALRAPLTIDEIESPDVLMQAHHGIEDWYRAHTH